MKNEARAGQGRAGLLALAILSALLTDIRQRSLSLHQTHHKPHATSPVAWARSFLLIPGLASLPAVAPIGC
jgi:hypothetical protein